MNKKKHIVFLLGNYYPYCSAVGKCMGNVIEILENDYHISVICFNSNGLLSEHEIYSNQELFRLTTPVMAEYQQLQRKVTGFHGGKQKIASAQLYGLRLLQWAKNLLGYYSIDQSLVAAYLEKLKLAAQIPIDLIIPVCNPFDTVMAAGEYCRRHPSTSFIPFLFDKFSVSQTLHRLAFNRWYKFQRHLALEEKMIQESACIVFVDSWQKHLDTYFQKYQKKFRLIEHPLLKKQTSHSKKEETGHCRIVYTGVVDNKIRPPDYTLKLFEQIIAQPQESCELHFYVLGNAVGKIDQSCIKFPDHFINHGSVPSDVASQAVLEADILLSIGNTDLTQTASKIFEYMSTGKPIVHLYHDEREPAVRILNKYSGACLLRQDEQLLQKNQQILTRFLHANHAPVEFRKLSETFFNALPGYSADIIRNVACQQEES